MWYLKRVCSQKVLRLIIQQSTKVDVYKIKNTHKKIVMCDGSLQFNSGTQYIFLWGIFYHSTQSIWPQQSVNSLWSPSLGMQQAFPCLFLKIPNSFLGQAILMVCIYSAEANSLSSLCRICHPSIVSKAAIVAIIMLYLAPMLPTVFFKSMLCFQHFS